VHNDMHMRWTALPRDPITGEALPLGRNVSDFGEKWDNPAYDALLDFYSSHVNAVFWRLHGWIDDRIEDWFDAQELVRPGTVTRQNRNGVCWFRADGRWVIVTDPWVWPPGLSDGSASHAASDNGGHGSHQIPRQDEDMRIKSMEKALVILFGPDSRLLVGEARSVASRLLSLP
jgi:hypothetical protein